MEGKTYYGLPTKIEKLVSKSDWNKNYQHLFECWFKPGEEEDEQVQKKNGKKEKR